MAEPVFAAIDLKSFYASVECVDRGLDPLTTHLVVADESRTDKTICLAVSPSLKQYGLSGRSRLFEVVEKAREVKATTGKPLEYIVAAPRMRRYMEVSAAIYEKVYLRFAAPEDIHVYSIDEVFIDLTRYLGMYRMAPRDIVQAIILSILKETGITATGGIGTNLYLAKVAMDIMAKHVAADAHGVRIAELNERAYRSQLWAHTPITDFWRVGQGTARRLAGHGCFTMGDVARLSLSHEEMLYKEFGIDAELLIDHAWGLETCTMADIKAFEPEASSISVGQVLAEPYPIDKGRIIVREMADQLSLELAGKHLVTDGVDLVVGYDREAVDRGLWRGETEVDRYGRHVPKTAHGTAAVLDLSGNRMFTSSTRRLVEAALSVYDRIADPLLSVRRVYLAFQHTIPEDAPAASAPRQLDLFTDIEAIERADAEDQREQRIQRALIGIKQRYGKNAILRGTNYQDGATARERNAQIGGHAAGEEALR